MRRKGPNRYSPETMAAAIRRIEAGASPHRVAKEIGIPRTTILHWIAKGQMSAIDAIPASEAAKDAAKRDGKGSDPAEIIKRGIYITYWRACLKHLTIISKKPKSVDAERSSRVLKNLEFKVSAVWTPEFERRVSALPISDDDKITFREFIVERKQKVEPVEDAEKNQRAASLDGAIDAESEPGAGDSEADKDG